MPLEWRIYYHDREPFDSSMGEPWDAPKEGVQVIVFPDPEIGRACLCLGDYYLWYDDMGWVGVRGDPSFVDAAVYGVGRTLRAALKGRMLSRVEFNRIYLQAYNDPDFPRKSNRRRDEHPIV